MLQEGVYDFTKDLASEYTGLKFASEAFAFQWAKRYANDHMFNIIRSSRRERSNGTYHHYFSCECAARSESEEAKQKTNKKRKDIFSTLFEKGKRLTASKRVGCHFRGVIRMEDGGNLYQIEVFQGRHNHPLTYYIQGSVVYTSLTNEDKEKIREMYFCHCTPRAIVKALQYPDAHQPVLKKAVYNYTAKLRKDAAEGRNPASRFLQLAREREYVTRTQCEPGTKKLKGTVTQNYSTQYDHCCFNIFVTVWS